MTSEKYRGVMAKPGKEIPIFTIRERMSYKGSQGPCFPGGTLNLRLGWGGSCPRSPGEVEARWALFLNSTLSALCFELPG